MALNDAQLKALIVEKSIWLQNTVTGDKYMIIYGAPGKGANGQAAHARRARVCHPALPRQPGRVPAAVRGQEDGAAEPDRRRGRGQLSRHYRTYYIKTGRSSAALVGTPIEITVYKVGDKYLAARSNEFGYANYEIIPAVAELNPLGAAPGATAKR